MLTADVAAKLDAEIPLLSGRVKQAADLAELIRRGALPQSAVSAFVLPLGLRARGEGEAMTGAFIQMLDESIGILLVVRAAGDVTGVKSLPSIDALVSDCIAALCGWEPPAAFGVLRVLRGQLLSAEAGTVIYQLDFATQSQVRILT